MPNYGDSIPRTEDARFLIGESRYVANLDLPDAAHVTYVTSTAPHARILGIDVSTAREMPGVLDVVTAEDIDVGPVPPMPGIPETMAKPLLAKNTVRFVGEPVVAIVSETREAGVDAADEVVVDLEPLPTVPDVDRALAGDVLLFPEAGTNVALEAGGGSEDVDVDACEVVVRATFRLARVAPCPLETRAAATRIEADGRVTHWSSCQGAHPIKGMLSRTYGLPPEQVRVIAPDVGGGFGAKITPYAEEVLLPFLARRVGRPVRWIPTRSQDMVGLGHGRDQIQHVELGGRRDGTLEALRVRLIAEAGAYPLTGTGLGRNTGAMASGAYRIPAVSWQLTSLVTNTTPTVSYRGAGRPEAASMIERAVDLFAAEAGLDPVEVRRRNFLQPGDFPYISPTGPTYDSGDYERGLDMVLSLAGYDKLRAEQEARREAGDRVQLGIGVSTVVDRTAGVGGPEFGSVLLRDDGSVLVRTGSSPYGQGHHTSWAMLVSERTGIPMEEIEVVHGDTDVVPRGGVTGGSRSVQRAGAAVAVATDSLVEEARNVSANLLEASVEDVVLDLTGGGRFHVAGAPVRSVRWEEVAEASVPEPLSCEADVGGDPSFPSGAYLAAVEVDTETGGTRLRQLTTVDDAGRILNPLLAQGQVHGGAAQGVAQALYEEFVYDADANPLTTNFADYAIISAPELPSFHSVMYETPSPTNPLGAKGIGESGTVGAPPAVQSAVVDALSHLGVRHIDLPCTPRRVWEAVRQANGG